MLTYSQTVKYDRCFTQIDYLENCDYSDENLQATFRSAIAERDRLALFDCHIDLYQLYIDHRGLDKVPNTHRNNVLSTSFRVVSVDLLVSIKPESADLSGLSISPLSLREC